MSVPVTFVGGVIPDLHLGAGSDADADLIGAPLAGVAVDLDGDARDAYNPKMGADEGTPLPPLDRRAAAPRAQLGR